MRNAVVFKVVLINKAVFTNESADTHRGFFPRGRNEEKWSHESRIRLLRDASLWEGVF